MAKKALAVVSFGTTYPDALHAIETLEQSLGRARPNCAVFRAFTSTMVVERLRRARGVEVETPDRLFRRLAQEGYDELLVQTTHVIPGVEYDLLRSQLAASAPLFKSVRLGEPLLMCAQDYADCCPAVIGQLPAPLGDHEALVLMGHGTGHFANAAYSQLENTFRALGHERVYVGTVEGFPDLDYVLKRLERRGVKTIYLMPFMIVAGDHARNDLAGEDADSWKSLCEARGYEVRILLKGLGELVEIGAVFARHLNEAKELFCSKVTK